MMYRPSPFLYKFHFPTSIDLSNFNSSFPTTLVLSNFSPKFHVGLSNLSFPTANLSFPTARIPPQITK